MKSALRFVAAKYSKWNVALHLPFQRRERQLIHFHFFVGMWWPLCGQFFTRCSNGAISSASPYFTESAAGPRMVKVVLDMSLRSHLSSLSLSFSSRINLFRKPGNTKSVLVFTIQHKSAKRRGESSVFPSSKKTSCPAITGTPIVPSPAFLFCSPSFPPAVQ